MDPSFWHKRWQDNEIAFHEAEVNPLLVEHFNSLGLAHNSRILVPLCGKSHDLTWLAEQGLEVIGVELSKLAAESYFNEQNKKPMITITGGITSYKADKIEILVGDIFHVTKTMLGDIDAIYDRAALVALPEDTRRRYTKHLMRLTNNAKQLLINYEYDQSLMDGPPFSISAQEINRHYVESYDLTLLTSKDVESKLKGHIATEHVWILEPM